MPKDHHFRAKQRDIAKRLKREFAQRGSAETCSFNLETEAETKDTTGYLPPLHGRRVVSVQHVSRELGEARITIPVNGQKKSKSKRSKVSPKSPIADDSLILLLRRTSHARQLLRRIESTIDTLIASNISRDMDNQYRARMREFLGELQNVSRKLIMFGGRKINPAAERQAR